MRLSSRVGTLAKTGRAMAAFDLVIFDLDGVLVDSERLSCGCLQALLGECGLPLALDDVYARFLGRGIPAIAAEYQRVLGAPIPGDFGARFEAAVAAAFTAELRPMAGIADLLHSLDMPFCLASSSGRTRIALSLKLAGLAECFGDRVFSAEQVARGKPAPDLFLHAAAAMGTAPERCLVIEDSMPGITAGRAAGMTVWGFAGGSHLATAEAAERLRASGAAAVFGKMHDLRGALETVRGFG